MARRALASCSVASIVALGCGIAHADTPVDQPTALDVDRMAPPAGRSELGFDGGAPLATWGVSVGLGYLDRPYVVSTGIAVEGKPIFGVQYHPEASPGPHDASYLFARFRDLLVKAKS